MSKWKCEVVEDPDNPDELLLQFPPEMVDELGWKVGDDLKWVIGDDGIYVEKVEKDA